MPGLRIAYVTSMRSLKYGGLERFVLSVARECAARGHRFFAVWETEPAIQAFVQDMASAGAHLIVMPGATQRSRFFLWVARWLHGRGIDVLHAHFVNPAPNLSLLAARLVGVPLPLFTFHGSMSPEQMRNGLGLRSEVVARIRRSLGARFFTVSKAVCEQWRRLGLGGPRMVVHYIGIAPQPARRSREEVRRELGLGPEDLVLTCFAYHYLVKGVDVLLQAVARLTGEFPSLRLLVVGGTDLPGEADDMKRQARALGVADRVVWLDFRDDVPDLLAATDVYCQPSRREGMGFAPLEAMAARVPVVASRVGGMCESIVDGHTGVLVPPESPTALADALAGLLRDEAKRRQMGEAGARRVRRCFLLQENTRRLIDTYERMARRVRR